MSDEYKNHCRCNLCGVGHYPDFGYGGPARCDNCGTEWEYDEGNTITARGLDELWAKIPKWIPVSERLPEGAETVVGISEEAGTQTMWLDLNHQWHLESDHSEVDCVTHWMPLPDPPTASAQPPA